MDFKAKIIDALEKLRQIEQSNKEPFKAKAYATAIKSIKEKQEPINNLNDIKGIKGIGEKIHAKIKEILETGELKQLEEYSKQIEVINQLTKIHGIGPIKAKELVEDHNILSIDDLKLHLDLLNDKQKMGLRYCEDFMKKIPRKEMIKHDEYINEILKKIEPGLKIEIVGSYRRGAKESGDIDCIITKDDEDINSEKIITNLVSSLKKEKYLVDDFALGSKKYLGVCKLKRYKTYRRIDFLYASKNVWPFSIIYFTGNVDFNVILRKVAIEKNLSLSEYGFKKNDVLQTLPLYTEEDVFKYLGYNYIPPNKRSGDIKVFESYKIK